VTRETETFTQVTIMFPCGEMRCEAFFFKPKNANNKTRVIVMGHGFGAQKDFGLEPFALEFIKTGFAVFMFDYRCFGGSEGQPRNLISPTLHVEDWLSAIDYVLGGQLPGVSVDKIALWGSSFAGGHVIVAAATHAKKGRIGAVISQVPFSSGFASAMSLLPECGPIWLLKVTGAYLIDQIRTFMGLSRYYVPIVGSVEQTAILASPEAIEEYPDLIPSKPRGGWKNKTPATIGIDMVLYFPISYASGVDAPTLVLLDTKDSLCPADNVRKMASEIKSAEIKEFSSGHFGPYERLFGETVSVETKFLEKHMK